MKILIYYTANNRAVDQQSQAELLIGLGHTVYLLTHAPRGPLHENCEKLGVNVFSAASVKGRGPLFFLNHVRYLIRFCRQNGINIIFSHVQSNAIISGVARFFLKAKCYYFRHNSDYISLMPSVKNKWMNRMANRLSPRIVAISGKVKQQLIKEGVPEKKILRINYCYNFSYYKLNTLQAAPAIRKQHPADILLLSVARLDPLKRHELAFEVVRNLCQKGINCKLILIGDGPLQESLEKWIRDHQMQEQIFLAGFASNTIDYFEASDMLIHLSYSEASSHVVKEAGMCARPVIVCHDVGDFDDYLEPGVTACMVNKEDPVPEAVAFLTEQHHNKKNLEAMGLSLQKKVMDTFSIDAVKEIYKSLLTEK